MTGQELHDKLRAELPDGASCISDCPFCATPEVASEHEEVKVSDKLYDQEAVDALLANARSKASEEAREEADKRIAELEALLVEKDEALATASAHSEELEGKIEADAENARLAVLADERSLKVAEVTEFSDEYLAERKAAWAGQSEDEFTQTLTDFKAITETAKAAGVKPPKSVIIDPTRETAGANGTDTNRLREFLSASGN
jgi:DNA repair exonuclease SbcCD ATPase subunit